MAKYITNVLVGMILFSGVAEARYIGPLLVKEGSTGYTLPEYSKTEKCEIYSEKTVMTTKFGGPGSISSVETRNQTLAGGYTEVLKTAQETNLVKMSGAVDGPSVRYFGFIINPDDSVTRVLLYDENGGSGQILNNPSSEALLLKNVIESLCPHTLKGIGPAPGK